MSALFAEPPADLRPAHGCSLLDAEIPEPARATATDPRTRILYVDDDDAIRSFGKLVLTRSGYVVATASDGAQALAALRQARYDLLITDNRMPRLTGLELIRQVRMQRRSIPVILASGTLEDFSQEVVISLHFGAMLPKPFTAEQLISVVHGVLPPASSITLAPGHRGPVLSRYKSQCYPYPHWGINE